MKFTAIVEDFNTALWSYHIKVPQATADQFLSDGARRVFCKLDNRLEIQCGIMPNGEGVFFILLNKKVRDKLQLKEGSSVTVSLRKDDSKYGLPMPEELEEVLKSDSEGDELFHALPPGKQRTLLYVAGKPKSSDKRIAIALAIIAHLKMTGGVILFKQLNESLKQV